MCDLENEKDFNEMKNFCIREKENEEIFLSFVDLLFF